MMGSKYRASELKDNLVIEPVDNAGAFADQFPLLQINDLEPNVKFTSKKGKAKAILVDSQGDERNVKLSKNKFKSHLHLDSQQDLDNQSSASRPKPEVGQKKKGKKKKT